MYRADSKVSWIFSIQGSVL